MKCTVCGLDKVEDHISLYDDRYGYSGKFTIVRCLSCGHKQIQEVFLPSTLARIYTDYYPRASYNLDQYQPHQEIKGFWAWLNGSYSSAFRWVPKNVRVLDIGCGFGQSLGYHKARGCDVYGVEADSNVQLVADRFGYNIHIGLFDVSLYELEYFDYVTADQVIEHIIDPIKTLSDVASILKPHGKVILSTPNSNGWGARVFGKYWINWHTPYHLQHFSKRSLELAANKAGLVLEKAMTMTNSEWLYYQWIHLFFFPKIDEPSVFWSHKTDHTFIQKVVLKILRLIHKSKVNHLVSRFFDAVGLGDNYIFILSKSKS